MNEQKRNRIAAAITINVILLIAVLVVVIVYQLVVLGVITAKKKALLSEIEEYNALIEKGGEELEVLQSEQYLLDSALKYGYYFPD